MRWRLGWALVRVRGRSMMPTLLDGDYVLIRRRRAEKAGTGDIVCLARPGEAWLIKRLGLPAQGGGFHLSGDGPASQPSIDLGIVRDEHIEGRAVLRLSGSTIGTLGKARLQRLS